MRRVSIAIVGAGPSGCYTAQALRKKLPDAQLVIFDRLPVPYGLLRYGVAADHQGTKGVVTQFERLFEKSAVEFRGGVRVDLDGSDGGLSLTELREAFDAVVLATGLDRDRALGVPGDRLIGVIGSGALTRALNSHPDEAQALPRVGERIVVVGGGNIAADVVRLLLRSESGDWSGSDMDPDIYKRIVPNRVRKIDILVRSDAASARWDAAMIRELGTFENVSFKLAQGSLGIAEHPRAIALSELLAESSQSLRSENNNHTQVTFHFEVVVDSIEPATALSDDGSTSVGLVRIVNSADEKTAIECDTVVAAIGFEPADGTFAGVYKAGWFATGPRGTIPQQRAAAQELALTIFQELSGVAEVDTRLGLDALPQHHLAEATTYASWQNINAQELALAGEGRVRRKLYSYEDMRTASKQVPQMSEELKV